MPATQPLPVSPDRCPLCSEPWMRVFDDARDYHVRAGDSPPFSVAYCSSCELGWSLPLLSDAELAPYYPETYEAYSPRQGLRARLQSFKYTMDLRLIRKHVATGKLFEIGAGRGEFLKAARDAGFEIAGLEPSPAGRRTARDVFGINLVAGYGSEVRFAVLQDVVVARHSLEHMNEPMRTLENIARSGLKPGGLLFLKLPTMDSWERRLFGKFWAGWDLPRHRVHFTPSGLARRLKALGFTQISIRREIVPIDWVQSLIYQGKYDHKKLARLAARGIDALPGSLKLVLGQLGAISLSAFRPGRMIVTALRGA